MEINVVYLAYLNEKKGYNIETVEKFLNSYKEHSLGIEASLKIIAKNWHNKALYKKLIGLANKANAEIINLPDDGWDIGAYFRISKLLKCDYVYFLGSSINIISDNWLLYSYNAFKNDSSVQLVGAMGSWEDPRKNIFPNYHIRTCSFMMKRELFSEFVSTQRFPKTKLDTYQIEHGGNSLTNFVLNKGYQAVVVNSDGEVFAPENWIYSQTFHYPGENKSMFSDKQTRTYEEYDEKTKRENEVLTWGQSLKKEIKKKKNIKNRHASKIDFFVSYNKEAYVVQSKVFHPIFNGKIDFEVRGFVYRDNTEDNISEKNPYYGELTGHYWVWKNFLPKMTAGYVGFCHYRRFLDFDLSDLSDEPYQPVFTSEFAKMGQKYTEKNIFNFVKDYDIVLSHKILFSVNVYQQYVQCHKQKDIDLALNILKDIYPEYVDAAQEVMSAKSMHMYGCFVMKKELFSEFMEWMFNILDILEQKADWSGYDDYNKRTPAFITERFLNIWLTHNIKTRDLKVTGTTSFLLHNDANYHLSQSLFKAEKEKIENLNTNENLADIDKEAIEDGKVIGTTINKNLEEPSKVKIFVGYHRPNIIYKSNVFQPILTAAIDWDDENIIRDDEGINIASKNPNYAELTGHYWVWKNFLPKTDAKYVGFCHYRRFLDFNFSEIGVVPFLPIFISNFSKMFEKYTEENIFNCIKDYDIVLPAKYRFDKSVYEQYLEYHPKKDLDLALDVIKDIYPEYFETAQEVMSSKSIYICLNFVMKKELLEEYMEWMFNVLTNLEQRSDWNKYTEYFTIRIPAFIAERFFNIWFEYKMKTQNLKVLNTTSVLLFYDIQTYLAKCVDNLKLMKQQNAMVN